MHTLDMIYVVCPKSSGIAMPWNCAPRIGTCGPNCQRNFLSGRFEASGRSCASRATGIVGGEAVDCGRGGDGLWEGRRWIVGGEAMDSPPRQCPRALCINPLTPNDDYSGRT